MSASPRELPERADDADAETDSVDESPRTPITPDEFDSFEQTAFSQLRTHGDVRSDTDWVGRLSAHIEHNASPPRPRDLVRALEKAPDEVIVRSVGTVGVSDYRFDPDSGAIIQRSFSEGFQYDAGSDETIRVTQISTRQAAEQLRESHLIPADHWGVDLEAEFERYREWQEAQR